MNPFQKLSAFSAAPRGKNLARLASILLALLALDFSASAAVSDFTRTAVADWNGREGVTFVRWSKGGTPRGFAFSFDLAKGYRFRAWHGAANTNGTAGSGGFPDVDAYRMMIDLGCNEVGELDGGGSATMWAEAGPDAVFLGSTTAHGGYVMKPRDTSPRKVGNGIFVLPPDPRPQAVEVATGNFYTTLEEALEARSRAPSESIAIHAATVASDDVLGRAFPLSDAAASATALSPRRSPPSAPAAPSRSSRTPPPPPRSSPDEMSSATAGIWPNCQTHERKLA